MSDGGGWTLPSAADVATMAAESAKKQLITLVKDLAYLRADTEEFTLASGRTSRHFFDMKPLMLNPDAASALGLMLRRELSDLDVSLAGGLELGAVPLTAIAVATSDQVKPVSGFIVRKEPKGRGGRKTGNPPGIEGASIPKGARIAVLEDVTTTGGSAISAVKRLQEECEADVAAVITILDREEGGAEAFAEAGIELRALLTMSDIVSAEDAGDSEE